MNSSRVCKYCGYDYCYIACGFNCLRRDVVEQVCVCDCFQCNLDVHGNAVQLHPDDLL